MNAIILLLVLSTPHAHPIVDICKCSEHKGEVVFHFAACCMGECDMCGQPLVFEHSGKWTTGARKYNEAIKYYEEYGKK